MAFESARYYTIDGQQFPSVTTALGIIRKPVLEWWRGEMGNEEADRIAGEAADLGTDVHGLCQDINRGLTVCPRADLEPILAGYQDWFNLSVEEVLAVERVVVSRRYQYAGTLDLLAVLKGDSLPTVIDIKTSRDVYPDMGLQLAGYRGALAEEGIITGRRLILWLGKHDRAGRWKTREFTQHDADYCHFLYALSLWRYLKGGTLDVRRVG